MGACAADALSTSITLIRVVPRVAVPGMVILVVTAVPAIAKAVEGEV